MVGADDLKPLKYNWLRNGTIESVRYLFLPYCTEVHWLLVVFDVVKKEITVWNIVFQNGPYIYLRLILLYLIGIDTLLLIISNQIFGNDL